MARSSRHDQGRVCAVWERLSQSEKLDDDIKEHLLSPTFPDKDKPLRYYQEIAVNRAVQSILQQRKRVLLDYTMLAREHEGIRPTPATILSYIAVDDEWSPKIEKLRLTEASIQNLMVELEGLFVDVGGSD